MSYNFFSSVCYDLPLPFFQTQSWWSLCGSQTAISNCEPSLEDCIHFCEVWCFTNPFYNVIKKNNNLDA